MPEAEEPCAETQLCCFHKAHRSKGGHHTKAATEVLAFLIHIKQAALRSQPYHGSHQSNQQCLVICADKR